MAGLFQRGQITELQITDYAFGGKGIAKIQTEQGAFVVFVPNTFPGQHVKARIAQSKKRYAEGKLIEILRPSPAEASIPYQPIPGAPYATLPLHIQEQYKEESAIKLLHDFAKIPDPRALYEGMISSPSQWHYRNKMEYAFSVIRYDLSTCKEMDDFGLGFKHRGTWWAVENLDRDSGLFDAEVENKLHEIREWCQNTGLPAWHPPRTHGFFRFLTVRKSISTNKLLFMLVTSSSGLQKFSIDEFVNLMKSLFGDRLAGIQHTLNDDTGDRVQPLNGETRLIYGEPLITEELLGLTFEISMQSFFQTNPECAALLYQKVVDYVMEADISKGVVMDLFCGTGTIAQLLARKLPEARVIGVDLETSAIRDAENNAKRNKIQNAQFYAADAGKFLREYPQYAGKIATVVLDPPRGGIAPKTLQKIISLQAPQLVYVSCNPATQARDLFTLQEAGYKLIKFCLVDQFPHTSHVESIALLQKHIPQ